MQHAYTFPVDFEWDAVKNAANLAKHGIDFEEARAIFSGPVLERVDDRRDYGETRIVAVGIAMGRELCVVYTVRSGSRRLISARRANTNERKAYRQAFGQRSPEG
jgi:uncharacterized DUF497 family protein